MATCLLIQVWLGCYHYFVRNHHLDWQDKKPTFSVEFLDFTNSQIFPQEPPFLRLLERQNAWTVIINDDNPVIRSQGAMGRTDQALTTRLVVGSLWSVEFLILIGISWKGKSSMLVAARRC